MPYASQQDLENALGVATVTSIFDDDMDGKPDPGPLVACLESGDIEVNSAVRGVYPTANVPFDPVPPEIRLAATDFCVAYAARRRPDIVKAMGSEPWTTFMKAARQKITDFATAKLRLPAVSGTPANVTSVVKVGGVVKPDGCPDRTFDKMGDF